MRRAALALLCALAGCPSGGDEESAPTAKEAARTAPEPRGETGTVVGVVRLAEGATLPKLPLDAAGSATKVHPECPPLGERDHTPVFEVGGRLANVFVSATGEREKFFAALPEREPAEVELVIGEDCRLSPRLVGAVKGDTLALKNRSPVPMLPFVGKQGYVESLSSAETRREPLEKKGVHRVACGVTGYCGSSDLIIVAHPVFGVTDETGRFEIHGVPADQPITLHAWHPLFVESTVEVRVGVGERAEVELVIGPPGARAGD